MGKEPPLQWLTSPTWAGKMKKLRPHISASAFLLNGNGKASNSCR